MWHSLRRSACVTGLMLFAALTTARAETPIDLGGYDASCAVRVEGWNGNLRLAWPIAEGEEGEATLDALRTAFSAIGCRVVTPQVS